MEAVQTLKRTLQLKTLQLHQSVEREERLHAEIAARDGSIEQERTEKRALQEAIRDLHEKMEGLQTDDAARQHARDETVERLHAQNVALREENVALRNAADAAEAHATQTRMLESNAKISSEFSTELHATRQRPTDA